MIAIHTHQTSPEVAAAAVITTATTTTTTTKTTTVSPQPFHYEVINKVHLLRSTVNTGK
jgi:hypothetical protein